MTSTTTRKRSSEASPPTLSLAASTLGRMLHNAQLAAGPDDTLPVLTAVHLRTEDDTLVAEATDRYRLLQHRETVTSAEGDWPSTLVSVHDLPLIFGVLRNAGKVANATLTRRDKALELVVHDYTLTLRVQDGEFPETDKLFIGKAGDAEEPLGSGNALDPRFLASLVKVKTGSVLRHGWVLRTSGPNRLVMWTPEDPDARIRYAIMPRRVPAAESAGRVAA